MNKYLLLLILGMNLSLIHAQGIEQDVEERLQMFFKQYHCIATDLGTCRLDSFRLDSKRKQLWIYANERFAYQPFRNDICNAIYQSIKSILPAPVNKFDLAVLSDRHKIEELIPNFYRKGKKDKERLLRSTYKGNPLVSRVSRPYDISKGLEERHIAVWQSHGYYYANRKQKWEWQRPYLYGTAEDLFTQSIVIPYLIPMLENAGAYVFTPRERDTQRQEVIVDNDGNRFASTSVYLEEKSKKARWKNTSLAGFAHLRRTYQEGDNPFQEGTARFTITEKKKNKAFAEWVPDIPQSGAYAVYVSYQSLPQSVSDAKYLVFHNGGVTEFKVNQRIGGGTWVYLGTFQFDKGCNNYGMVVLSNESKEKGVICADAVRFGGGMGNIARDGKLSGMPRYLEGARYTAQWAGMPTSVYSRPEADNDYADDINCRSRTINYLSGGSVFNPQEKGLGIPLELSVALHSDAGYKADDKIVGTLGIYTTQFNDELLANGTNRYASRDLCDILQSQLQQDIQSNFDIQWTRRAMWNRNYSETRLPTVASTIIELLSHQNFADLQMGHDPQFKFTVGRAIYKGILKYLCSQHGQDYVVQPLPVNHFAIQFGKKKRTLHLSWKGVEDATEPTAAPHEYIVYTRIGRGGFDNGVRVTVPEYDVKIEPGIVYSFRVTAVNRGGESFPSEILSACQTHHEQGRIMIINGFDRISGPAVINNARQIGFNFKQDAGVPYLTNFSYCGPQLDVARAHIGAALGDSGSEWVGMQIAGNSFDYPFIHGKAIRATGKYSFTSCSDESVEDGTVDLGNYQTVDYILGMEKDDRSTNPANRMYYKTFTTPMQRALTAFCQSGGNVLVSGAYLGSDMNQSEGEREFTRQLLKYSYAGTIRTQDAYLHVEGMKRQLLIPAKPNEQQYAVSSADCLQALSDAFPAMTYPANRTTAAVAYPGKNYRTFVMGFPFESISRETDRTTIMASILQFLQNR